MTEDQLLHGSIEHLHGPSEIPYAEDELVVVCLVRDGRPYVKSFIEHYFSLGVKHIVFLDNDSSDSTVPATCRYDNVTVLQTKLPFKHYDLLMKQYLISRFGRRGRWCLYVDIDELFDYPYSEVVGLDSFLRYLTSKSYTAVMAHMLDMFPEKPLSSDRPSNLDEPLKEVHRFYDITDVTRKSLKENPRHLLRFNNTYESHVMEQFRGGIRQTVFGADHNLTKQPLVFLDGKIKPMHENIKWVNNARVADLTCVLLHYKFLDWYFHALTTRNVREEQYSRGSVRYKKYLVGLGKRPSLQGKRETAREMKSVNELLEDQFLVVSEDYVS
jgi:glycosyl transferase family 2